VLDALAATGVGMAVANLPDPTLLPFLRHAAGDVSGCRTALLLNRSIRPLQ
jgi:hypothetical protein